MGTNRPALGYESCILWIRIVQPGYKTSWVRNVQGTKRPAPTSSPDERQKIKF